MSPLVFAGPASVAAAGVAWKRSHNQSPAVQQWQPTTLRGRRLGALHTRTGGDGERVVVLLHGLVATGDIFGLDFDALAAEATLVAPDLLGFGRSPDRSHGCADPSSGSTQNDRPNEGRATPISTSTPALHPPIRGPQPATAASSCSRRGLTATQVIVISMVDFNPSRWI